MICKPRSNGELKRGYFKDISVYMYTYISFRDTNRYDLDTTGKDNSKCIYI